MPEPYKPPPRTWINKFQDAFAGIYLGVVGQSSFIVHSWVFVAVVLLGVALRIEAWQWTVVLLVSGSVVSLELVNSAIESLARSITNEYHPSIDQALKIASAAVLIAALTAILVGLIIFLPPLWKLLT